MDCWYAKYRRRPQLRFFFHHMRPHFFDTREMRIQLSVFIGFIPSLSCTRMLLKGEWSVKVDHRLPCQKLWARFKGYFLSIKDYFTHFRSLSRFMGVWCEEGHCACLGVELQIFAFAPFITFTWMNEWPRIWQEFDKNFDKNWQELKVIIGSKILPT